MNIHRYKVFGLNVESELELPELSKHIFTEADVTIKIGNVPDHLSNIISKGVLYETNLTGFLLKLKSIASYYVKNGNSIIVMPVKNSTDEDIRLFLLGSSMGALLHQRGYLPIHGSAIKIDNYGLIIAGLSSSGKSSLAAGFSKKGYQLLADDISVVTQTPNNTFIIQPGIPHLKLWKDIIDHLDYPGKTSRVRPSLEKYIKQSKEQFFESPVLLKKIIILAKKNSSGFNCKQISGSEKFELLRSNTYRLQFSDGLGQTENQFKLISTLSNATTIYKIERPSHPLLLHELVSFIEKTIL